MILLSASWCKDVNTQTHANAEVQNQPLVPKEGTWDKDKTWDSSSTQIVWNVKLTCSEVIEGGQHSKHEGGRDCNGVSRLFQHQFITSDHLEQNHLTYQDPCNSE